MLLSQKTKWPICLFNQMKVNCMKNNNLVYLTKCKKYDLDLILASLPDEVFNLIKPGDKVVLKPNWVRESHKNRHGEWDYVITHPSVIAAVLHKVLKKLSGNGRISIIDGPMTDASFEKLIARYPVKVWQELAEREGVSFEIIDLRDHEWLTMNGVTVKRKALKGDPRGKVVIDLLGEDSEFWGHRKSHRGYYGADYDIEETNRAHDGFHNLYSVSRTVLESDVFINIPKLKTHRKAGITCCLKNLVGINTYKNFLPHHLEGCPTEDGDQFPDKNLKARIEGPLVSLVKKRLFKNQAAAFILSPLNTLGKSVFGDSSRVIRNGSWYGNDTLWRMILDLNKVLFFSGADGKMMSDDLMPAKRYIGVVDAIMAGDGEGPISPDPVKMGYIVCGENPASIDATCAVLMGFEPERIPTIERAFRIKNFSICKFKMDEIKVSNNGNEYLINDIPDGMVVRFRPQFGWMNYIEKK
jgi:uncharacterized protein (DUF362 family)